MRHPALKLRTELVGRVYLKAWIVHDEALSRRQRDRFVDRRKPFRKQGVVIMETAPALTVVRVRDVVLGARAALGRIRAGERRPGLDELVAVEEPEAVREGLLVDAVRADG